MSLTFTWLGHSTFLVEADGHALIIDPFITNNPLLDISVNDIQVDTIVLTHAHGDHVGVTDKSPAGDTIAISKRNEATIVCNFEMGNWFMKHGVPAERISQGNTGGTVRGAWADVRFTKAFHSSSFEDGSYGGNPSGVIIRTSGYTVYHAGDTELFGDMAILGEESIDLAILPIGDVYTMGVDDSIRAVKMLKPKFVAPCHYNTFPPIVQDAAAWADRINRETGAQPIVIDPKQSYTLE
jgi:L-ascorbate metabolism protein UlaG (beta-lactamase superfamily)